MDKLNQVNVMVKHEQSLAPAQPVSKLARSMWARWVFISLAWLCIALGILGILFRFTYRRLYDFGGFLCGSRL